jgi:hypothetical protein
MFIVTINKKVLGLRIYWTGLLSLYFFECTCKVNQGYLGLVSTGLDSFSTLILFERAVNKGFLGSVSDGLDSSCSSLLSDTDIEYNASSPDEKALGR